MAKTNQICENCIIWKTQGNKCWYHWELKQQCTQKIELPVEFEKNNVSNVIKE